MNNTHSVLPAKQRTHHVHQAASRRHLYCPKEDALVGRLSLRLDVSQTVNQETLWQSWLKQASKTMCAIFDPEKHLFTNIFPLPWSLDHL